MLIAKEAEKMKKLLTSIGKNEGLPRKIKIVHFMRGRGRRKIESCMWRGMGIEVDHITHLNYTMQRNIIKEIEKKTQSQ